MPVFQIEYLERITLHKMYLWKFIYATIDCGGIFHKSIEAKAERVKKKQKKNTVNIYTLLEIVWNSKLFLRHWQWHFHWECLIRKFHYKFRYNDTSENEIEYFHQCKCHTFVGKSFWFKFSIHWNCSEAGVQHQKRRYEKRQNHLFINWKCSSHQFALIVSSSLCLFALDRVCVCVCAEHRFDSTLQSRHNTVASSSFAFEITHTASP